MGRALTVVLAIGTTHPLNVAGVGLDARIAALLDTRIVTIVAGISAQSASRVLARAAVDPELIAAQFTAVLDAPIDAVHIGALLDARSVQTIARELPRLGPLPIVCDPVIAATGGDRLADDATIAALRDDLFARCTLVTPNIDEAALLLDRPIGNVDAMEAAALELRARGAPAVLVKGGHLAGDAIDVLVDADGVQHFRAPRLPVTLRGTGDLLACAIAARLAHGDPLATGIERARAFVRAALAAGVPFAGTRTML